MKIRYFEDTDTLFIGFRGREPVETLSFDENTTIDVDAEGNVLAITFERASKRTNVGHLTVKVTRLLSP